MQLEVASLVTDSEVVLSHLGLGCVEGHLVAGQPSLITDNSGTMNGRAGKVEVDIAAQINIFTFVGGLDFSALLAVNDSEKTGLIHTQCQLQPFNVCLQSH